MINNSEKSTNDSQIVVVNTLNVSLHELCESPIDKRKVKSKSYSCNKIKKNQFCNEKEAFH